MLCLTVLVAPISWTHYDLLLLIADRGARCRGMPVLDWRSRAGLVAALVLMAPPVVVLSVQNRIGNALYERVLISHYFFGALLLLGVLIAQRLTVTPDDSAPLSARPSSP